MLRLNSYKYKCKINTITKLKKLTRAIEIINLRNALSVWRITNYNSVTQSMFTEIKQFEESKINHQKQINKINTIRWKKIIKVMATKREAKIFNQWREIARTNAILKRNEALLNKRLKYSRLENTLVKWRSRVFKTKKYRRNMTYINNKANRKLMLNAFESWKNHNFIQNNFIQSLCRVSRSVQDLNKAYAFIQIQHFGASRIARKEERKIHSAGDIAYLLNLLYKSKLSSGMHSIKLAATQNNLNKNLIKRVFLRA